MLGKSAPDGCQLIHICSFQLRRINYGITQVQLGIIAVGKDMNCVDIRTALHGVGDLLQAITSSAERE